MTPLHFRLLMAGWTADPLGNGWWYHPRQNRLVAESTLAVADQLQRTLQRAIGRVIAANRRPNQSD